MEDNKQPTTIPILSLYLHLKSIVPAQPAAASFLLLSCGAYRQCPAYRSHAAHTGILLTAPMRRILTMSCLLLLCFAFPDLLGADFPGNRLDELC